MPPPDLMTSHETPLDLVEIRQDAAITVQDALLVATDQGFPIGKSTIQRWARHWAGLATSSPVKTLLVTTRTGNTYRIDRDDFITWVLEQKQNARPHEVPQDLERPLRVSEDPMRSQEVPRDLRRPLETSQGSTRQEHQQDSSREDPVLLEKIETLQKENMELKIDVAARKQVIQQMVEQAKEHRGYVENVLLQLGQAREQVTRLLQIGSPRANETTPTSPAMPEEGSPTNFMRDDNGPYSDHGQQNRQQP